MNTFDIADIKNILIHGRTGQNRSPLALFWSGSGIELNVRGKELWVELETDYDVFEQWIAIEIDGEVISRRMLDKGRNWVCLFRGMSGENIVNVRLYKEVQPMGDDEKNCLLVHAVKTDGTFEPVKERKLKIEFIGDSLTSGEGLVGAQCEMDWIPQWFSSVRNYSTLAAKELDADHRVISQSGWGVLAAFDNNPDHTLPKIYDKVCGVLNGKRNVALGANDDHDFSSWKPDIIFVNLGTNDVGAFHNDEWKGEDGRTFKLHMDGDKYDKNDLKLFQKTVEDFLRRIRELNPDAVICWIYGMLGKDLLGQIRNAVKKVNDGKIYVRTVTPAKELGARQHPGAKANARVAADVAAITRELLNADKGEK